MKSKKFWFLGSFILIGAAVSTSAIVFTNSNTKIKALEAKDGHFFVNVSGAVKYPDKYYFDHPVTFSELIKLIEPKQNSNLSKFSLNTKYNSNTTLHIPYINELSKTQNYYIKWETLSSEKELIDRGISQTIAKKIVKFRKDNNTVSWKELNELKGIGPKTIEKLQQFLIL
ncbi:MAG0490 family ComEA-like DNA-binding protein [Mycoplasmopsis felifaucium]|uniref:MAG0490 family ComEA-like DNA-binding protein n=1 Tax=Mycoplasmopsis felifaucium TaxID=35768 RepID=UPI0004873F70|nr:helix-hairpin-helix domain-containing protein [Mycoplasmopsis felifaucium]